MMGASLMQDFMSIPVAIQWTMVVALGIGLAGFVAHLAETVPAQTSRPDLVWATLSLMMTVAFALTARWALGG